MIWPLVIPSKYPGSIAGMPAWSVARTGTAQRTADALVLWASCHEQEDRTAAVHDKLHEWHDAWAAFAGVADAKRKTKIVLRLFERRWDEVLCTGGAAAAEEAHQDGSTPPPAEPPRQPAEVAAVPHYVLFDKALPLSDSAANGKDRHAMTTAELLAALLVTDLERQGNVAAVALVREAMALAERERAA